MDLKEICFQDVVLVHLAQNKIQWQILVNMTMNLGVCVYIYTRTHTHTHIKVANFFTS